MNRSRKIDLMIKPCEEQWYVKPNDLIGGWCVMPMDSTPGDAPYGVSEVADFCSKEVAEHIVELHNKSLKGRSNGRH